MNILFATSEAAPFAKTGGLGDVSSSLPIALSRLGHKVHVVMPAYRQVFFAPETITDMGIEIAVPVGGSIVHGRLLESKLPDSDVQVILIQQEHYFDRNGIYNDNDADYSDNCERFVFFSRAVMELIETLEMKIDILHSNDWQTGLIPAYQEIMYRYKRRYQKIATLHTIHNLAYQGIFWHWDMVLTGIDWRYFTFDKMEFYGKLNLMKTGIAFAMGISTVSPRYAMEIQTPNHGCALDSILRFRSGDLRGILNGVCTKSWNPATDENIAATYDSKDVFEMKPICKAALQTEMGLELRPDAFLIGVVGRLAHQKGIDLILETAPDWIRNHSVQYCILGTGDQQTEKSLRDLQQEFPNNVAVKLEFSNKCAHQVEAGADLFLMPSRYEPCGLNQMYSQMYGTVPLVHETGGLADTVIDACDATISEGSATGFSFSGDTPHEVNLALWRAIQCYYDNRKLWQQLMLNGMHRDWSWDISARKYVEFYEELLSKLR